MVHNVLGIEAILADGTRAAFNDATPSGTAPLIERLARDRVARSGRDRSALPARDAPRRRLQSRRDRSAVRSISAKILVGSEGTLAFFTAIELTLQPLPRERVLGICHFPRFYDAMDVDEGARQDRSRRGRARRPHDARALARESGVRADDRTLRARPARRNSARRVHGRRCGAVASEARRARRVHVRARLSGFGREGDRRRSAERDLGGALRGARTS